MKIFANKFGIYKNVACGLIKLIKPENKNESSPELEYPIPLISVHVNAYIIHAVAQVEVTQVYVNKESQPIEAIYYFPINPDGAVTHFHAELDGRIIKGKVMEHEKARKAYKKAIKTQTTALLGEETKVDIFKIKVGYLKPGSQVEIMIHYVTEVKNEGETNAMRFYIPTTIAPRYVSPSETDEKAKELRNMTFSEYSPAPLSLHVEVNLQDEIKSIQSPTNAITVDKILPIPGKELWRKAVVELRGWNTDMDRDFVLNVELAVPHKPRLYSEKLTGGSTAMMIHLIPSFKLKEVKVELMFVLDCSGSMVGESITLAKKALLIFLHSMPADCYFNIVKFGTDFEFLFPTSVKYDDDTLKQSINCATKLDAYLGGTEILGPLEKIYETPLVDGYSRQVFVITDGEVSNTSNVIGTVKSNANTSRVFALGIGESASHHLVEGIAKAGGGTCNFVTQGENLDKKVIQLLKNSLQPAITDIHVEWEGLKHDPSTEEYVVQPEQSRSNCFSRFVRRWHKSSESKVNAQSPKCIPPVFNGSQLLVFGIFENEIPTAVNIFAFSPDQPIIIKLEHSDQYDVEKVAGCSGVIHRLAGVKLIRELEIEEDAIATNLCKEIKIQKEIVLKNQITQLALKNGLSSRYTSFVAIDKKLLKNCCTKNWSMQTRNVDVQVADVWQGRLKLDRSRNPFFGFRSRPRARRESFELAMGPDYQVADGGHGRLKSGKRFPNLFFGTRSRPRVRRGSVQLSSRRYECCLLSAMDDNNRKSSVNVESLKSLDVDEYEDADSPLEKLLSLQSFDGSFLFDKRLSDVVGVSLKTMKSNAQTHGVEEKSFATAVAVGFFENKLEKDIDVWELVVKKAREWLESNLESLQKVQELIEIAVALI
ncbi:unnamed protein product [Orchesella dallaii]|uniref:von Willebrand factor A domain-containing protein 5A n=1 Tax=Orchesella dallaii TaxID=48710 RepID=A0ABP1RAA9_9HEXA